MSSVASSFAHLGLAFASWDLTWDILLFLFLTESSVCRSRRVETCIVACCFKSRLFEFFIVLLFCSRECKRCKLNLIDSYSILAESWDFPVVSSTFLDRLTSPRCPLPPLSLFPHRSRPRPRNSSAWRSGPAADVSPGRVWEVVRAPRLKNPVGK